MNDKPNSTPSAISLFLLAYPALFIATLLVKEPLCFLGLIAPAVAYIALKGKLNDHYETEEGTFVNACILGALFFLIAILTVALNAPWAILFVFIPVFLSLFL